MAIWTSGCFSLLLYAFVAFVFAVCRGGEIGESGKYRLAKAYGARIFEAIDKYHRANNTYPPTLGSLVPQFLTVDELRASEDSPLKSGFRYRVDSGSYKLSIEFHEPGVNTCRVQPGSAWICGGYF